MAALSDSSSSARLAQLPAARVGQLVRVEEGRGTLSKCRDPGLNQGPSDLQSDALPTELSRRSEYCNCSVNIYLLKSTLIVS